MNHHEGMGLLERRYRAILRLLPASYRAEREEEMVAAFMEMSGEVPDEVNPRPRWGEIASVLALSTRVRLGGAGATPGQVARGEAVRLVALLGMGTLAAFATAGLIRVAGYGAELSVAGAPESAERLSFIGDLAASVLSILAFVTIMRGHVRAAKAAALLGLVPTLGYAVLPLVLDGTDRFAPLQDVANLAFVLLPPLALLIGFHGGVAPRRRPWALALAPVAAGAALTGVTMLLIAADATEPLWYFLWLDHGAAVPVWAAASVVVLARRRSPSWALALSATGLVLLATRLPLLDTLPDALWPTVAVQCALLGTLAVATGGAGVRAISQGPTPAPVRP
ncbi:unnamed protein product [[Actinomadura] parvosata subsp. kistnae]|uniref:Uncharacterized protein n=1 Tax=[Actinomadura] parvosata subsp. kistnae TaxID=1909395 RepID=A0A1V0A6N6_9ACTN|nr:hypothetical protein [Nonomuraea sp. ATCC 55076]AQZ65861.1 hypothetical protein BKM31_34295 [Nonomuraea sp. ATCC 55076]SPL97299.1 unnamed protein product [Actinomadura parvosata subsp. kistnae]